MKNKLLLCSAALGLLAASPANASVIIGSNTLTNAGDSATINFNGFENIAIPGLTAALKLTLNSISATSVTFGYSLLNNSTLAGGSRVSAFGFDVDPTINAVGVTGTFTQAILNGQFPVNQAHVDACITGNNNCQGGGNGGVTSPNTGTGMLTLGFGQNVSGNITLSNFEDRYQAFSYNGISSGVGTQITALPEPDTWAMLLIGFGAIGAFMRRRKPEGVKGHISFG